MKVKVLIVDDEKLERVLIRNGYAWEENGFTIVGEAGSGAEALEVIERKHPDIVFTDIHMPHMDGLELAENIRKLDAMCRIVIITGYREFDYARKAVRIGVEDFLLKPLDMEEMGETVRKLREQIIQEKQSIQEEEERRESVFADYDIVRESLCQRLVEGRVPNEEAIRRLELYGAQDLLRGCICINIELCGEDSQERQSEYSKKLLALIQRQFHPLLCFVHYTFHVLAYFLADAADGELGEKIHRKLGESLAVEANIGVSEEQKGIEGIVSAYRQSEKALGAVVVFGKGSCILYRDYLAIENENENEVEIAWNDFLYAVQNGIRDKVEGYVEQYIEKVRGAGVMNLGYLRLMTMNIISKAGGTLNRYGRSAMELLGGEKLYMEIEKITTIDEMRTILIDNMQQIMDFHRGINVRRNSGLIEKALEYIDEHLTDPDLSLKTVAACVFANESYLSRIFKKEMGESMIEYVTKKRIAESIRLLKTTDLKVYEIAERIGFRDSHYFGICFKKQVGVTVKEFKQSGS